MPALVTNKGKAVPSFYGTSGAIGGAVESVKPKLPLFAVLILGGVAAIFLLRNRSSSASTGPALTVVPSNDSDTSSLDNLTQAVNALVEQGQNGGATSPITPTPNPPSTIPATLWGSDVPAAIQAVDPTGARTAKLFPKGYGTVINMTDLQSAFTKNKLGYGTVINPTDVTALYKKAKV